MWHPREMKRAGFWWEILKKKQREINMKMDLKYDGSVDWDRLAHDRNNWRVFVSTVMNLRLP